MNWLHDLAYFFGGGFLANSVPHLVAGLMGRAFQTPFAKPPGKGYSSSLVNILWGMFNLIAGYALLAHVGQFDIHSLEHVISMFAGCMFSGLVLSKAFGDIHGGTSPPMS